MKTYKHLYPQVVALENLQRAYVQASKGKRRYGYVDRFAFGLERELFQLQRELQEKTYQPGPYNSFYITEPKRRLVSAAPFRDRVVHHAVCNVLEPIYERMFIYDSYACRVGKGQHRAADRYTTFCRKRRYVFKCDVRRFFPSVDHAILLGILRRRLKDEDLMGLVDTILRSGRDVLKDEYVMGWFSGDDLLTPLSRDRGLPIGNLTSQFLANVYLNELDHFVKEDLRCRCYVRYMDDMVIFDDDKGKLWEVRKRIIAFLERLRLSLHPEKNRIFRTDEGVDFLGYRIFPTHRRLRRSNVQGFVRRMKGFQEGYHRGVLSLEQINPSVQSWIGHAIHADTYRLRTDLFHRFAFVRAHRDFASQGAPG